MSQEKKHQHTYLFELDSWPTGRRGIQEQLHKDFACIKCHQNWKFDLDAQRKSIEFFNKNIVICSSDDRAKASILRYRAERPQ